MADAFRQPEGLFQPEFETHRQKVVAVVDRVGDVSGQVRKACLLRVGMALLGCVPIRTPDIRPVSIHHVAYHDAGEASVGEHAGQPLSRENSAISGADAFGAAEGNMDRRVMRVPTQPGVVVDPGMHGSSLHGNREISGLAAFSSENTVRSGKARSRSR